MAKRFKMNGKKSRKLFSKRADLTHKYNMPRNKPMRGGIRL